ncbi:MAG: iron uptake porin, partial [Cyanobacteriota bacterium]|nr:iron uptake porin [Cyanobacteriota bacterium]
GSGVGLRHQFGNSLELSLGYLAGETNNPEASRGLFNSAYGAMAQLVYKPNSRFQLGLTYINSYNRETLTGSPASNPQTFIRQLANQPVNINLQPPASPGTPIVFPASQPIPAGTQLPQGTQLPAGTTLDAPTTLPFAITVPAPAPLPGTITLPAGTTIPAGTTLPAPLALPIDLPLPVPITPSPSITLPAPTTPPLAPITFNGTVGDLLRQPDFAGVPLGFDLNIPIASNSYGLEVSWQASDRFVLGGLVGYTQTNTLSTANGLFSRGSIDTINGAITLAFPNLGKKGNLAGIIVGVEPFVLNTDIDVNQNLVNPSSLNPALIPAGLALLNSAPALTQIANSFNNVDPDVSLHIEAFYQMQLTDNISVTPGVIWITAPGFNSNNTDLVIGTIRTTFRF